jgi:4-hydroxy-tetrahydrodipicolinate synthase
MSESRLPYGVWSAVLTPVDAQWRPDASKAVEYYDWLLHEGIDGLNVLGTTGEAPSFGTGQRVAFMEALARGGLPAHRIMTGTGTTSLEDTVALTQTAIDCGFAAALVMPPFFFRDADDDGVVGFFGALIARLSNPRGRILLYNFPAASGIAFHAGLVDRLLWEFPETFAGMKDSSNDAQLQREVLERHPGFAVFPSSEEFLVSARAYGACGCISGSVALWPQLAQRVWKTGDGVQKLTDFRRSVAGPRMLACVRYLTAKARGDDSWERPMPPLTALSAQEKAVIETAISRCA